MNTEFIKKNLRILVIDDNRAIHDDFRKILCDEPGKASSLDEVEAALFDSPTPVRKRLPFEIDSAFQGREGLEKVQQSLAEGRPYAMAFVDVRMPPGWDGIETVARIWEVCPDLQIVICTAYSDYSWDEMSAKLTNSDQLLILKKPFDAVEVLQLANALTEKWRLQQQARLKVDGLEKLVQERTKLIWETNENLQREVVERRKAAEALKESEERYQLLFRRNPMPMWVFDNDTLAILAVNETAVREYGYSTDEFCAMTIKDIRPPEELPLLLNYLSTRDPQKDATGVVTKHRRKDGSVLDVEVFTRPINFDGKQAQLVLASNITERKAAEDRIREQAMLLNLAQDAIYVRDMEGRIQFWNPGAEQLFGITAQEALGNVFSQIIGHDDAKAFATAERALLEKGEWSGELRKRSRTGQTVIVNSRWTLLRNEAGKGKSVLSINTDITDKKKLEAQFLRSQRMEGIGTLAAGVAHDLNNILAPILMSAETLRWDLTPEEREETIARIEFGAQRGAEIIQQVLTFGRGVDGERVAVRPPDLLLDVGRIVRQTFPKNLTISFETSGSAWPVKGDRTQLHQVMLNLCINARDAMPHGGELWVVAKNVVMDEKAAGQYPPAKPGSYVMFQVVDTGCGISTSNLERIFDPFFTTKEFGKGTGLGLSTALGIVKSHHGFIAVESELNKGTTFRVYIPAMVETAENAGATTVNPAKVPGRGTGELILIVDDEIEIVATNRKILEKFGYKVLCASDGAEGVAVFAKHRENIDAVLTDIMMPNLDGIAMAHALKELDPGVQIIASSGLDKGLKGGGRGEELRKLGVRHFLTKPYSAEKLLAAMEDCIAMRKSALSRQL
jgi:two-component system, cell cycle sensor histidine kinase and response regulator CckA